MVSRREFLIAAAVVAGGVVLAACEQDSQVIRQTGIPDKHLLPTPSPTRLPTGTAQPTSLPTVEREPTSEQKIRLKNTFGVYLPYYLMSRTRVVDKLVGNFEQWGVNTLIVDIKSEYGHVNLPFEHPWKIDDMQGETSFEVVKGMLDWADKKGVYLVARIPVMTDNIQVRLHPELAFKLPNGDFREDSSGNIWLNPFLAEQIGGYNAAIAGAAAHLGFKEIQLDYIRLPEALFYISYEDRVGAIATIVAMIKQQTGPTRAFLTADLFAETAIWEQDMGIGQDIKVLGEYLDGICPMAYPNLRSDPDDGADPYKYVYAITEAARLKLESVNPNGFVNPWIQAYSPMSGRDVERQAQAAMDAGAVGAFGWNNALAYPGMMFRS